MIARSAAFFATLAIATRAPLAQHLELGKVQAGDVVAGTQRSYALDLPAGQFVHGRAVQVDVDLVVEVRGPAGNRIGQFDATPRGPEAFWFETENAGVHHVVLGGFEGQAGTFQLELLRVEPVAGNGPGRVDQLMAPFDDAAVPGGVIGVVQDGELVFARGYGAANLTHGIAFTADTVSNLGSTSKQFTGFAMALLASRGELSLDDDVRKHIPELPDFGKVVTLRHLLTHTSGYREFLNAFLMAGRRIDAGDYIDRSEMIPLIQRQPELQNDPGATFNYNNTGYVLATIVVERVAGRPFDEWMKEHVFLPLGMEHTTVRALRTQVVPGAALGYSIGPKGYMAVADLAGAMGPGAIYTTVGDMARWVANLTQKKLGGDAVYREMTTSFVRNNGRPTGYGLGLFLDRQRGLRRVQHGGADSAHRAMMLFFPELKGAVVAMSNNSTFASMDIASKVAEAFFGEHMESREPAAVEEAGDAGGVDFDMESFAQLAGRYELAVRPGFVITFSREGDRLFTQATGQRRIEMVPTGALDFALQGVKASVTFHPEPGGRCDRITLHQGGDHEARRIEGESWQPSPAQLQAYVGRYFSVELEAFYEIAIVDDGLVLKHRRLEDIELKAAAEHEFHGSGAIASLKFVLVGDDVEAFIAANGRTLGVRFVKQP